MRVGIDATNLRRGGGVTHAEELLHALDPAAHGVERVIVWASRIVAERMPARPWLEIVDCAALEARPLRRLWWQRTRLPREAADRGCDVLLVPGGMYEGRGFAPVVTMFRNMLPFDDAERHRYRPGMRRLRLELLRRAQTRSFRRSDGVIFLTRAARDAVLAHTGPLRGRTAVIPHGVSDRFRNPTTDPARDAASRPVRRILYVSIVNLYKHQWHVVEAVRSLRAGGLDVTLDLVGPAHAPPPLARLEDAIERCDPRGEFVSYRGAVPRDALPELYRSADLFVFASSCENMPNILLEAMAAGLPIACSDRGPMPDILRDAGVYFDPEQPATIAAAIDRLVRDEELRRACAARAAAYARDFTWQRCARETFAFLADVAHHTAGKGPWIPTPNRT